MALTFTSNKRASNIISDASGFKGALDYAVNADIVNNTYVIQNNGEHVSVAISDIFQVARTTPRGQILDENLKVSVVPANTPRRTYLPSYATYGILIEEARFNFFDQSTFVTKPSNALPVTTNTFACYAIGGSAKVSASQVDIISGSGTYSDPQYFTLKSGGTVTPTVTIAGSPTSVQVEQLVAKPSASAVPSASATTKTAESMTLPAADLFLSTQGCLVLHILENTPPVDDGKSGYTPYFQISFDESNYLAMNRRIDRDVLTLRVFKDGTEMLAPQVALTSLENTVAISWNNGEILYAVNGTAYKPPVSMNANFKANAIRLLSAISGWVSADGNSALANMITYNRALTLEELAKATKSWN